MALCAASLVWNIIEILTCCNINSYNNIINCDDKKSSQLMIDKLLKIIYISQYLNGRYFMLFFSLLFSIEYFKLN